MIYWLYLLLAIAAEVIGTLSMKYASVSGDMAGYFSMYIMIGCSYFLLSKAVIKIALGVAYALWEGLGLMCITSLSVMWFNEPISVVKVTGLAILLMGIVLVKSGTVKNKTSTKVGEHHAA
jgi:spermidine export protein MdtJ